MTGGASDIGAALDAALVRKGSRPTRKIRLYLVEQLADDAITGIERNKTLIVTPQSAHLQWLVWRLAPQLSLRFGGKLSRIQVGGAEPG